MRDFTWHVFTQTGDIEAYLLYKEMNRLGEGGLLSEAAPDPAFGETEGEPASP
ncbi:YqzL family protein [Cohnella sp. AR92]|uniref:YqzL family protein n=1 Tax=Cohnella sp. AR92 TaxID=648716 RepID=UPI000F8DB67B|nr:YqzL family protein [Cohnella sp. AR92]RUS48483.1 YqzL family protein [Cohnella sp. AR92]